MQTAVDMREAEVVALREEVRRLRFQLGEVSKTLEFYMQPEGASNVIEAWVCVDLTPSSEKLRLLDALREVCDKEGWE